MIIYNVTVKIQYGVHNDWLDWMQNQHIGDVMETGLFLSHRLCRLIDPVDKDGFTYAIQYFAKDIDKIKRYQDVYAEKLQKEHHQKFGGRYVAFRTLLKVVE